MIRPFPLLTVSRIKAGYLNKLEDAPWTVLEQQSGSWEHPLTLLYRRRLQEAHVSRFMLMKPNFPENYDTKPEAAIARPVSC